MYLSHIASTVKCHTIFKDTLILWHKNAWTLFYVRDFHNEDFNRMRSPLGEKTVWVKATLENVSLFLSIQKS